MIMPWAVLLSFILILLSKWKLNCPSRSGSHRADGGGLLRFFFPNANVQGINRNSVVVGFPSKYFGDRLRVVLESSAVSRSNPLVEFAWHPPFGKAS